MKILPILLLFMPVFLFGQGNVGVGTVTPEHPFQVNVDSAFTEIVSDQSIPGFSQGHLLIIPAVEKGAQQITIGQTGKLSAIELKFISVTEVDEVLVEVFRGAGPGGTLMTSKTLFDIVNGIYLFEFPLPWPEVTIGEVINIVVTPGPGASFKWNRYINNVYSGGAAYQYNGTWTALDYDLYLTSFVEVQDTVAFDVLRVQSDRKVGINNYVFPRQDGQAGDVIQTDGNGTLSWSGTDMLNVRVLEDTDQDTKVEVESTPDDDIIRFTTDSMERMTILQNGKVGLNTLTPVYDLDIRGDNDVSDGGELQLATPSMTNFIRMFGGRLGDPHPFLAFHDTDTFHFVTSLPDWSTYTRRMTIAPDGKIGIGNDKPLSLLDIKALGDGAELLRFTSDRPWVFKQTGTGISTALTLQSTTNDKAFQVMSENGLNLTARFFTNNTYSKVALVPNGGEVGIGILEATAKLHVRGNNTTSDPQLRLTETSTNDFARIKMENENEPGIFWDIAARADSVAEESRLNFYYANPGSTGDKLTILGNGNIGIGITSPTEKLHINGDLRVSGLAGSGDRNVIVDSDGKLNYSTLGPGGDAWIENGSQVSTTLDVLIDAPSGSTSSLTIDGRETNENNFAALAIYNSTFFPGGTYHRMLLDADNIDVFRGTGVDPLDADLYIQNSSGGDILLANGGGKIGIGTTTPGSRLTIHGTEANGTYGVLEIKNINSTQKMLIDGNGIDTEGGGALFLNSTSNLPVMIGSGNYAQGYKLSVRGKIMADEIRVQAYNDWPDYVFLENYSLLSLDQLKKEILNAGHLPGIPSSHEIAENGIHLGEMQRKLLEKIEELTLHVIALHERILELEEENDKFKSNLKK
jgi:hypothetical protein